MAHWGDLFHYVCPANNIYSEVSGKVINIPRGKKKKEQEKGRGFLEHSFEYACKELEVLGQVEISKSRRVFTETIHKIAAIYRVVVSQTRKKNI